MNARARSRFRPATLAVLLVLLTFLPPHLAAAGSTCSFDTGTITIDAPAMATSTIVRSGDDILFDGATCGGATVTTTGQVSVTTHEDSVVVIDLSGGPFAPGTSTTDDDPEIKFAVEPYVFPTEYPFTVQVVGTDGPDLIAAGRDYEAVVNLDADEPTPDEDLRMHVDEGTLDLQTQGGDDRIWLDGGTRVDTDPVSAFEDQLFVETGPGDDWVECNAGDGSLLDAGDGVDTLDCGAMASQVAIVLFDPNEGTGRVLINGGEAIVTSFEDAIGSRYDDFIYGLPADDDRLVGGRGNDALDGEGGKDHLVGGTGRDGLFGRGGDDVILGGPGGDRLRGGAGFDLCRGGTGHDLIHGCE